MNDFLGKIADILEEDLSALNAEMDFRDFALWDSLAQLSFIVLAKDDYNKELTNEDIESATSLQDLFELVSSE